jgi:hypothetical protein
MSHIQTFLRLSKMSNHTQHAHTPTTFNEYLHSQQSLISKINDPNNENITIGKFHFYCKVLKYI